MKKVKINGTDYNVKYTIRALFYFEKITGKAFEIKTLQDNYILFYCMILANNPDNILEWEDFLDAVDNDPHLIEQLTQINDDYLKKDTILNPVEEKDSKTKKGSKKISVSELFAMLVLRFKIPIDYVMDKIDWCEIGALLKFQHYAILDAWEMARFQSYISLKSQTNYKGEISDFLPFSWEKETQEQEENTSITQEEITKLTEEAKALLTT